MVAKPADRFQTNILDLTQIIKEIIQRCSKNKHTNINPNVIDLVLGFLQGHTSEKIIHTFADKSYDYWASIKNREESFFKDSCKKVFSDLPEDYVDSFRKLFETTDTNGQSIITDDEKNLIWDYFESFVKISLHYIHEGRKPQIIINNEGRSQKIYRQNFFKNVKLQKESKNWNVKLIWSND